MCKDDIWIGITWSLVQIKYCISYKNIFRGVLCSNFQGSCYLVLKNGNKTLPGGYEVF